MAKFTIAFPPFLKIEVSDYDIMRLLKLIGKPERSLLNQRKESFAGYFYIVAKHSGKCLDVSDWGTSNGANIQQWSKNPDGENQQWMLMRADDGSYYIFSKHSGKCIDVCEWSQADGANVHQWDFHGDDNQKWEFKDAGDGLFFIVAKHSQKCLDVCEWSLDDGANIQQWWINPTGDNQKWRFEPVS